MSRYSLLCLCFSLLLFVACTADSTNVCGMGTVFQNGECIPTITQQCGKDTVLQDGKCVPIYPRRECGPNTEFTGGKCVPTFACGPGTERKDGKCVPLYEKILCGPGTVEDKGQCLPKKNLACADGTREENGKCVPEDPIETCGPGRVIVGGKCITPKALWIYMPFEKGRQISISQGHHGSLSHKGNSVYAVDFPAPEGTKILAVRGGTVIGVKNDSDKGCGNGSCGNLANYVYIDHGDGTFARYLHLQHKGTRVKVGDKVCRGQLIGLSGNTGFSTGPHLHLEIMTGLNISLPVYFEELRDVSAGVAYPRLRVTSQNTEVTGCSDRPASLCRGDLFAYRGVVLDSPFVCWNIERGRDYTFKGRVGHNVTGLAFQVKYPGKGWVRRCIKVTDKKFSFQWFWPTTEDHGEAFLFISAAYYSSDTTCTGISGWSSSLRIWSRP